MIVNAHLTKSNDPKRELNKLYEIKLEDHDIKSVFKAPQKEMKNAGQLPSEATLGMDFMTVLFNKAVIDGSPSKVKLHISKQGENFLDSVLFHETDSLEEYSLNRSETEHKPEYDEFWRWVDKKWSE